MATPLQYQALSEGFKSGVEGVTLPAQERARTQTLSEQAQQVQMKTAEMRDEYTTKMASRAAFTKAQMDNVDIDSSTNQGQMQLYKAAAANTENPESKAGFLDKLNTLQEKETKNNVERSRLNVSQMEEVSLGVNQVLLDPSIGGATFKNLAASVKNPNTVAVLNNLAAVYEGKAFVPVQFTKRVPKRLQDLTLEESNAFKTGIREAFPGTKVERTAHNLAMEEQARLETARKREADAAKKAADAAELAAKREKQEKETKEDKRAIANINTKYNESVQEIEDKQSEILTSAGVSTADEESGIIWKTSVLSPAMKTRYDLLEKQKEVLKTTHKENLALYGKEQTTSSQYSPTEESWITLNLKGNPGMTREQIVQEGIKRGKVVAK